MKKLADERIHNTYKGNLIAVENRLNSVRRSRMMKQKLVLLLIGLILTGLLPATAIQSFALAVGTIDGETIDVTDLRYSITHDGFEIDSGYVEIMGENLKDVDVLFEKAGLGFVDMGTRTLNTTTFVKYNLNQEETADFTGRIRVGNKTINLNTGTFPNIQSSDKETVNRDVIPSTITFTGNYLDQLNSADITGTYGNGITYTSLGTTTDPNQLTLTNPINPGTLGYQNIVLKKTTAGDPNIEVEYTYQDAFRIIESLGLDDVRMFPNTGAKGDEVYFTSENFSDTRNYQVYFLTALDGSDPYTSINKADFVSLGLNINGEEDQLTVRVPSNTDFERRNYYVVITDVQNNQVVAEQIVYRNDGTTYDQYTVIQADYKPSIVSIYPETGPDTGSNVEIKAHYVLSLNIPDLDASGNFLSAPTGENQNEILKLTYEPGTYKGESVDITRRINIQIGKKARFYTDASGNFQIVKATTDQFIVTTQEVTDAETDPLKDVVIEIETVMEVNSGVNQGDQFVFNQIITQTDGFEFEPSTFTPEIDDVLPEVVQIEDTATSYSRVKNETLIALHGSKFLVDRVVSDTGEVITRQPTILIKKNDNNTFNDYYQLGFFPNEEYTGGGITVRGVIKYKASEDDPTETVLTYADGRPVQLEMTVLDDNGNVVDGTTDNQLGTKILIWIPNSALIADGGIKHIQVTNPMRDSDAYGNSAIKSDFIEFVKTSDIPVIESVVPNIITVEGGDTIVITGSNLQNGLRLFLDGEEITNFTRTLDNSGNKTLVEFTAPPGREGTTQVLIMNPSGGIAVSDFTYVKTFNQDPIINNFTPTQGTENTLVVVNGDNFLKPDPTAVTEKGVDAYRLIGSRILLDGKEVNQYRYDNSGNIQFDYYTVPATEALIQLDAGTAVFSDFYENASVVNDDTGEVALKTNDENGNPAFKTASSFYSIRYTGSAYYAYDEYGVAVGPISMAFNAVTGVTTLDISGGPSFTATMDNHLVRAAPDTSGEMTAILADYAGSVTLKTILDERFTLSYNFSGDAILTNGMDKTYTVLYDETDGLVAQDALGFTRPIETNTDGIVLDGTQLYMITPYIVSTANGAITGNRSEILSKNQIMFYVPALSTGKGYKDLTVVNPDTKSDSKTGQNGFYYIPQASSSPVITTISPEKGSVDGGYFVTISGSEFEDAATVYVDSVEVPEADTYVALDGSYITIKMPASIKNLIDDYGVDQMAVPVVVINADGGNAYKEKGFTYIIPMSDPVIEQIIPTGGSSNGGEIVEIIGYEFRYYEPYENLVGDSGYNLGDTFQDLYNNGIWDDLLSSSVDPNAVQSYPEVYNPYYDVYYESPVLPSVYFGEKEAKIVEYAKGYIKVITPAHTAGTVDVYVINNDSGVSNKVKYTYSATNPTISKVVPNFGKRLGLEPKDLYGTKLYSSIIYGYTDDNPDDIVVLDDVDALVRFGSIDNADLARTDTNSGLINSQRTTVNLDGGLMVTYYGDLNQVKVTLTENNIVYSRTFAYNDSTVYVPMDMLQSAAGNYYMPFGTKNVDATTYSGNVYEYVKLHIEDRRLIVERGYAPKVVYDSDTHVVVYTPAYYTIGTVDMTYTNTDGGTVTTKFTYTNPASEPKIYNIEPQTLSYDESRWLVESSVDGGIDIEITGEDFRDGMAVYIGSYTATVKEVTTKTVNGVTYDLIVANIPTGSANDINMEYQIMIRNEDDGLATSADLDSLIGPNYGDETLPYYFVYRQPLSSPRIDTVTPTKTSIYGGNPVTIVGSDFRDGAYVIIGTRAGIPIYDATLSERGTVLEFTTPTNMTLGTKTIQVLNGDYGIAVKENAITVVSAPTVESKVYDEDGNAINRIHVTGGQRIMIKGTNFDEGATVYFGGEWLTYKTGDSVAESEQGVYIDDSIHYVKDGYKGTDIEFVDSETLLVTTPEVTFEGDVTIVVRNGDGGISSDKTTLEYTVPIPDDPTGLKVAVVDDQYIKLYDYVSETAQYFEIYVYMGIKSNTELTSNSYRDFQYLGITNIEPYKIAELPGFDRIATGERIVFVVRAVNKFGPSGYSNLAYLTYANIENIESLGPTDLDGAIGAPTDSDYVVQKNGSLTDLNFAEALSGYTLSVDLTESVDDKTQIKRFVLPEALVYSGTTSITVNAADTMYRFTPVSLNTTTFKSVASYYDAYARLTENVTMTTARSYLTSAIQALRGKKQVSKIYNISFDVSSNDVVKGYTALAGTMDVTFNYDASALTTAQEIQIQLYKYNPQTGAFEPYDDLLDTVGNRVTARIKEAGDYVLLTNR
jgi:hypothetical protein